MRPFCVRLIFVAGAAAATLFAQGGVGGVPGIPGPVTPPVQQPNQPQQPAKPATPGTQPQAGTPQNPPSNAPPALKLDTTMPFVMENVSLVEVIDKFAQQLHMKYILDPKVGGSVTIHTYGEVKPVELMPLLYTMLRVNGMTMVQVGDLWRIIPMPLVSHLPLKPQQVTDPNSLPDDERVIMNLIFLKYATAKEMNTLIAPFLGEYAQVTSYDPANLLIIQDNSRSMKRTMELIDMFDSDTFASQRVRIYEVQNSRPTDLAKELDNVMKAYSATDKSSVRFMPIDRINTIIAVAPNPGAFDEVKRWIDKLDIAPKVTSGSTSLWVYQLKYQRAEIVAMAIQALYTGNTTALIAMSQMMNANMYQSGIGNNGTGYGGGGGGGGGYGNFGSYGMGGYGNAYGSSNSVYGVTNLTGGATAQTMFPSQQQQQQQQGPDASGSYLGAQGAAAAQQQRMPHVVPNPFNNTLLIQGSAEEYEQIANLLRQLDVAPRQVLIDAKIYEVDLDNEFAAGVESYLQGVGTNAATGATNTGVSSSSSSSSVVDGITAQQGLTAAAGSGGIALTAGAVVLGSKQLLGLLKAQESRGHSRVISSPSIIATDGMSATMNVGSQVPVLTSQGVSTGATSSGSSVFASTVSNQSTGVTLSITPHVSSSGVVTMQISQQVSAPIAATASSSIQSPSFSNRSMSTQLTIMDGDTVAIGGAILETHTESSAGIPFLHRIPIIGAAFGAKNTSMQRTELIIFLTPRVIYDATQLMDATDELKSSLKRVSKLMRDDGH